MMLRASGGADGRIAGEPIERVARRVIAAQQRFRPAAFTYDVMKKFGDDDTGTLDSSLAFSLSCACFGSCWC